MRNWHHTPHIHDGKLTSAISVGESSSFTRQTILINPTQKRWHKHCFVLWFGPYGYTNIHVYADHLEDALDECVDWIAEYAPGHLADEAVHEAYQEILAERVKAGADPDDEVMQNECRDSAEVDTTIAGNCGHYLHSWEWGIALEDPTTEELYRFVEGR